MMKRLLDSRSQIARFAARWRHLAALAVFAVVGAAIFDDYGVSGDGSWQRGTGYASLNYILGDEDALPKDHNRYYGVAFELPLVVLERLLGLEDTRAIFLTRHLLTHLLFLAGGFFMWLLAHRLFGSRLIALLAMLLFLLHPRMYAHSFLNTKDLPFLSVFIIALYLIHRAFRRDSAWAFALCGAGVGLLINIRIMGVMLFAAPLGMLALDAIHAARREGWAGMKAAAVNAGAFAAAACATLYATWPTLWRDPLALVDGLRVLSRHPHLDTMLFRGEWVAWPLPWDFVPAWMLVTTPPTALALAALGTVWTAYLCARRWRGALANTTARFGLLMAACAALPIAAAIALESNMHKDWRVMYFLYAPMCVLAAFGLRALAALRNRRVRAGAFALAALGIAATAVQMVGLHPYQDEYFSPLANRDGIAERWHTDHWGLSRKEALERMLALQPEGRVSVDSLDSTPYALFQNLMILPKEDRARVSVNQSFADFYVGRNVENAVWTREIYGAPFVSLADARDSARSAYLDAYETARSREPVFRAHFDIYAADGLFIYLKEPCAESDTLGTFTATPNPVHADALWRYAIDDGFPYGEGFEFWDYGEILGGACVMALKAPSYPLESLTVAYSRPKEERALWSADIPLNDHLEARKLAASSEPLARSGFDIYADGDRLIYLKENCGEEDARGTFQLLITPSRLSDLPDGARGGGLDREASRFEFLRYGAMFDGDCLLSVPLPEYPIHAIETEQWTDLGEGSLWKASIQLAESLDDYEAALSARRDAPDASGGGFDIWTDGGALTYVKSPCGEDDVRGRFSLSIFPADLADLPQSAREAGGEHESRNFDFHAHGAILDGGCVIIRNLPGYPIAAIETGQWVPGAGGRLWSVRAEVGE